MSTFDFQPKIEGRITSDQSGASKDDNRQPQPIRAAQPKPLYAVLLSIFYSLRPPAAGALAWPLTLTKNGSKIGRASLVQCTLAAKPYSPYLRKHMDIALRLDYLKKDDYKIVYGKAREIERMLTSLMQKLNSK